jgi:hypothetical protein
MVPLIVEYQTAPLEAQETEKPCEITSEVAESMIGVISSMEKEVSLKCAWTTLEKNIFYMILGYNTK